MESALTKECPICFTENVCVESLCGHLGCRDCLCQWMEQCEERGREATCFTCREVLPVEDVQKVLGREMKIRTLHPDGNTDDLTIDWMVQNGVKQCPWCGIWVERVNGCRFMRCFCQETFCFDCGLKIKTEDHEADRCRCFPVFVTFSTRDLTRDLTLVEFLQRLNIRPFLDEDFLWETWERSPTLNILDEDFLVGNTLDELRASEKAAQSRRRARLRAAKKSRLSDPPRNQKNKFDRRKIPRKDKRRKRFKGR